MQNVEPKISFFQKYVVMLSTCYLFVVIENSNDGYSLV